MFTSVGHGEYGEPLIIDLQAVGETNEFSWSEEAPVASNLHYAVTVEVKGHEVLWLYDTENTATVDASDAPYSIDTEPTGSIPSMSLPITIFMLLIGFVSIGLTMFSRRRDV